MPQPDQPSSPANDLVVRLAQFIDQIGGGYPLVTVLEHGGKAAVLWQYEKQDFVIYCNGHRQERQTVALVPYAPVEMELESIAHAFKLIRQTECIRQMDTCYPYLQFGPMPGTDLDTERFFHFV